jgi:hypothetical protein
MEAMLTLTVTSSKTRRMKTLPGMEIHQKPIARKKSGLKVATLISTPNPVSQVLW